MTGRIRSVRVLVAIAALVFLDLPGVGLADTGISPSQGGGSTLVVDNSEPCGGPGQPFCEIQDAIDVAGPGDTIEVHDGGPAYGPITIPVGKDDLEIEADSDPVIDGGGAGTAVLIEAHGVTVEGFEIRNADIGVLVTVGDDAEIEDCLIHDHAVNGVRLESSFNEVEDCELFAIDGPAILILGDIGGMGNEIEDNEIRDSFDEGILVCSSPFNTIEGNDVRDAGTFGNGIELRFATDNTVRDNCVRGMCNGICLGSADGNEVRDNDCSNNVCNGISGNPTSDGNWIEGNEAGNNDGNGFEICADANVVCGNVAADNGEAGFFVDGEFNCIVENKAKENGEQGFEILFGGSFNVFEDNRADENGGDGFQVGVTSVGNLFEDNEAEENGGFGFLDETTGGTGDFGTDNFYDDNECDDNDAGDSDPEDICD